MTPRFAVTTSHAALLEEAKKLATLLQAPLALTDKEKNPFDFLLQLTPEHLSLIKNHSSFSPLAVDFLTPSFQYRCEHATVRNEVLVRALGLKKNSPTALVDATGGLGRDSFILAYLGFDVTVLERSPLIYCLLKDGLQRARLSPCGSSDRATPSSREFSSPYFKASLAAQRITLLHADAILWLRQTKEIVDVIYLDPMFPERRKKAAVKKEMQVFQSIIGEDTDENQLLTAALACAKKRVVVKRPRLAESIAGCAPSFSIIGSSSRFDIYLVSDQGEQKRKS